MQTCRRCGRAYPAEKRICISCNILLAASEAIGPTRSPKGGGHWKPFPMRNVLAIALSGLAAAALVYIFILQRGQSQRVPEVTSTAEAAPERNARKGEAAPTTEPGLVVSAGAYSASTGIAPSTTPRPSPQRDGTATESQTPDWLVGRWEGLTKDKGECVLVFDRDDRRLAEVYLKAGENVVFGVRLYKIDPSSKIVRLPDDTFTASLVEADKLQIRAKYGGASGTTSEVEIDMSVTRVR